MPDFGKAAYSNTIDNSIKLIPKKNFFNKATITSGYYVNYINGSLSENPSYNASDYIEVEPNTIYTRSYRHQLAFYDANKGYISGINGTSPYNKPGTFLTPTGTKYIRVTVDTLNLNTFQVQKGPDSTLYEPYTLIKKMDFTITADSLKGIGMYKLGKNLFNPDTITPDSYVNNINGIIQSNMNYVASDYIEVLPNTAYARSYKHNVAFYDANKVCVGGISSSDQSNYFITPVDARYIRVTVNKSALPTMQVERGTLSTLHEPYRKDLSLDLVPINGNIDVILPRKIYAMAGNTSAIEELNLYFKNFIRGFTDNSRVFVYSPFGRAYNDLWRLQAGNSSIPAYNITSGSNLDVVVSVVDGELREVAKGYTNVEVVSKISTSTTRLLCIGDSMTRDATSNYIYQVQSTLTGIKTKGIRTYNEGTNNSEGRGGWTISQYTANGGSTVQDSPFMFPTGITNGVQYWGNTAFWANVVGANGSQYDFQGFQKIAAGWTSATGGASVSNYTYNYQFNSNGYPNSPVVYDIVYDPYKQAGQGFQQWNGTAWETMNPQPTWQFSFQRYLERYVHAFMESGTYYDPDIVSILLGANDFQITNGITSVLPSFMANLQTIINSIRSYKSTINIIVCLPIVGANQDAWSINWGSGKFSERYRRNVQEVSRQLLNTYDNDESLANNIFVCPMIVGVDPIFGFESTTENANKFVTTQVTRYNNWVHPNVSGYYQMGDIMASLIAKIR